MSTEKPRYTITVDDELFQQIEDYRFSERFPTRSKATEALIRLGLEALWSSRNKETSEFTEETLKLVIEQNRGDK